MSRSIDAQAPDDGRGQPAALLPDGVGRRAVLKVSATGIAVAWGGLLLSACSSSSSKSTPSGSAAATVAAGGNGLTADERQTLLQMVGPVDAKHSGKGMTWTIGGAFPFTGPAAYYQTIEGDGLRLAAQHIPLLGGPKIDVDFQNIGGTAGIDTQKAVDAVLNFHDKKVGAAATMGYNGFGALNPGVARYKIISIDPGAGVGVFPGKPYFWGMRAANPTSNIVVYLDYIKAKLPDLKSATVLYDSGPSYKATLDACVKVTKDAGFTVAGTATQTTGSTDWSQAVTTIRQQNPDFIVLALTGNDLAYFMKQYPTSGLKQPVFAVAYSQPAAKIAGAGFDNMYFAQEDFLPDSPPNDWGKIFTKYYRKAFTDQPSSASSPLNLSAAYYNAGFLMWDLARRVLAKGGDINNGEALQTALVDNPKFPSIFGGSGTTPGSIEFDTSTHGLKHQPFAVYQVRKGLPVRLATDDSAGGQLKIG